MNIIDLKTRIPVPVSSQTIEIRTEYCIAKTIITNEYQLQGPHDLYFYYFSNNDHQLFGSLSILHNNQCHKAYFKEIDYTYDNQHPKEYIEQLKVNTDEIKMPFTVQGQFKCILELHQQMEIIDRKYWYRLSKNFIKANADISLNFNQLILNTDQDIYLQIGKAQSVCLRSSDAVLLQYIADDLPIPQTTHQKEYYFIILTDNLFFINNFKAALQSIKEGSQFNIYTHNQKVFPKLMQSNAASIDIAIKYPYCMVQQNDFQKVALQNCLADISESDNQNEKRIIIVVENFLLTPEIIDLVKKQQQNIRINGVQLNSSQYNVADALCYLGKGNVYKSEQQDVLSNLLKAIHEDKIQQQGISDIQLIDENKYIESLPNIQWVSPLKVEIFRDVYNKYFYWDKLSIEITFNIDQKQLTLPIVQVKNILSIVFENQKNYLGMTRGIETSIRHQVPFQFTSLHSDLSFLQHEEMIVKISDIQKQSYEIFTTPQQTILGLKILISEKTQIHPDNIRLIICGRNCSDQQTLSDFRIKNGGVVHWVYRVSAFTFQIIDTLGKALFRTSDLTSQLDHIIKQFNYKNPKLCYHTDMGQQIYLIDHNVTLEYFYNKSIRMLILDEIIQVLVNDQVYYVKYHPKYMLQDIFDQIGYSIRGNSLYQNNQLIESNVTLGESGIKDGLHLRINDYYKQ